jgi:hypothetical protein
MTRLLISIIIGMITCLVYVSYPKWYIGLIFMLVIFILSIYILTDPYYAKSTKGETEGKE